MGYHLEIQGSEGCEPLVLELPDDTTSATDSVDVEKHLLSQIHHFRLKNGILGEIILMDGSLERPRPLQLKFLCDHKNNKDLQWLEQEQSVVEVTTNESNDSEENEKENVNSIVINCWLEEDKAKSLAKKACVKYWARIGAKENDFVNCKNFMGNRIHGRMLSTREMSIYEICKQKVKIECDFIAKFVSDNDFTGDTLFSYLTSNYRPNYNSTSATRNADAKAWYNHFGSKLSKMPEDHISGSSVREHVEKLIPGWYKADQYDDIELLKPGSDDNQINVLICTWNEEVRMLDNQNKGIGGKEKGRMAKEIWANAEAKIEEISSEVDIMKRRIDKLEGEKAKLQEMLGQRNEIISKLKAEVEAYRQKESKRQIKRQSVIRHSQARETNQYKKQYVSYRSDK